MLVLVIAGKSRAVMTQEPVAFWSLKPWWCQPWSIVLTGVLISIGSWILFQKLWFTAPVVLAVLGWWLVFLVFVPRVYRHQGEL